MTLALYDQDAYLQSCDAHVIAVDGQHIALDQTIAYPTGGGQPGDRGELVTADGHRFVFATTRKDRERHLIWHTIEGTPPRVGESLIVQIDWERRHRHMRFHTALHVLCCVVKAPVTGGQIGHDRARLDFDIDIQLLNADGIAHAVNEITAEDLPTRTLMVTEEECDANPQWVKTMSVSPPRGVGMIRLLEIPGIDLQPCGGTHVRNLNEIGPILVTKVRNEGKKNKRVEIAFVADIP
jgi:misacylated tRNA(Ala) deacylase